MVLRVSEKLQSIKGMNDLLPESSYLWQQVEKAMRETATAYGYAEIRPPLMEKTELFKRSIGEQTDIVEKEMYTFPDNNGESLTLRPEATASCVRACVEHGLLHNKQARLWYLGPMFRHERPQKGRYRQFHQFGIEALGWPGPDVDSELMMVANSLWKKLGVSSVSLQVNTLGNNECRQKFKASLVDYLGNYKNDLDPDSQRRLESNPLRILDSKNETTQEILREAPRLSTFLDDAAKRHFDRLCEILSTVGIQFEVNDRLVRGLDYYTSTVFEWVTDRLGAQSAVCAGGRYDGLVEQLGGKSAPSAGFALGLERLVELVQLEGQIMANDLPDAYVCMLGDAAELQGLALAESLRGEGLNIITNFAGGNFKKQVKRADQSGAQYALIIGEDEVQQLTITTKNLRQNEPQISLTQEDLILHLKRC
ncbi:MAG: histidyl-tRNA synthetase [Gammaproteobacteria bacterium]|jgi:histidyl-tRNA synthetase